MARRALVTGASGFAGRYLVEYLLAQTTVDVIGTVQDVADTYALFPPSPRLQLRRGDLRKPALLKALVAEARPDLVFHLAAQTFVPDSYQDPNRTLTDNITLQVNLLEALRQVGLAPRVLVIGSNEEYGLIRPDELPVTEGVPFRPTSPYAVSKIAQDMLGLQYFYSYGLPVVRVRPFNHIGPRQSDRFVVASFARQIAEIELARREPVVLVGNLDARRDFTDVRDVVGAYWLAIERGTPGDVYNVGSGRAIPVRQVLDWLLAACRVAVEVRVDPARLRPADVPEARCDASRLERVTGWRPAIDIHQTVLDMLAWWRAELAGRE